MPRAAGQIDLVKHDAILRAAAEVLGENGFSAPMAAIAERAKVSKQTIYNHYGAKTDLVRALVAKRATTLMEPLDDSSAEDPEVVLTGFARVFLQMVGTAGAYRVMRVVIQSAVEMPDLARDVFDAGPIRLRGKLAGYLRAQTEAGRLAVDDPAEAAEIFTGMAVGQRQLRALLGLTPELDAAALDRLAGAIARRFVRAYAP